MTPELRKAMLHRNRLRNKYYKHRTSHSLSLYKDQRNRVTAIKRSEISKYFKEKCKDGTRNKHFWKAINPLFSKSRTKSDSIALRENGEIVSDDLEVGRKAGEQHCSKLSSGRNGKYLKATHAPSASYSHLCHNVSHFPGDIVNLGAHYVMCGTTMTV